MQEQANIVIERVYPATPRELWDLWATKAGFESWWGPQGFRVEVFTLEPRNGGALHYSMIADTPEMVESMKGMGQAVAHDVRSTFSQFEPFTALTLTNMIDFLPGVEAYESTVEVSFAEESGGTRMIVTLHAMHDATFTQMQKEGFSSQLTKLDERYAK